MDIDPKNLRDLESVKDFVRKGNLFCQLLENPAAFEPYEFLSNVAVAMANLYSAAILLPEVDCGDEDLFTNVYRTLGRSSCGRIARYSSPPDK